jgi:hypothetical protein
MKLRLSRAWKRLRLLPLHEFPWPLRQQAFAKSDWARDVIKPIQISTDIAGAIAGVLQGSDRPGKAGSCV